MTWRLHIQVTRDDAVHLDVALSRSPVTIGAAVDNDLVLSHPQVSAHHGILTISRGEIGYQDFSTNGSFANGQRLSEVILGVSGSVSIPPFLLDIALEEDAQVRHTLVPPGRTSAETTTPVPQAPASQRAPAAAKLEAHLALCVQAAGSEAERREYPLDGSLLRVGRGEDSDIVLADATVSRTHAELLHGPDGWEVVDLGSVNGTFLNGRRLTRARIAGGESIDFGNVHTRIVLLDQIAFLNVQTRRRRRQPEHGPIIHLRPLPSHDHAVLIKVAGALDAGNEKRFTDGLFGLVRDGYRFVVLDLSRVSMVGPDVMGAMARLREKLKENAGDLYIAGLNPDAVAAFQHYGHGSVLAGRSFGDAAAATDRLP